MVAFNLFSVTWIFFMLNKMFIPYIFFIFYVKPRKWKRQKQKHLVVSIFLFNPVCNMFWLCEQGKSWAFGYWRLVYSCLGFTCLNVSPWFDLLFFSCDRIVHSWSRKTDLRVTKLKAGEVGMERWCPRVGATWCPRGGAKGGGGRWCPSIFDFVSLG